MDILCEIQMMVFIQHAVLSWLDTQEMFLLQLRSSDGTYYLVNKQVLSFFHISMYDT